MAPRKCTAVDRDRWRDHHLLLADMITVTIERNTSRVHVELQSCTWQPARSKCIGSILVLSAVFGFRFLTRQRPRQLVVSATRLRC